MFLIPLGACSEAAESGVCSEAAKIMPSVLSHC